MRDLFVQRGYPTSSQIPQSETLTNPVTNVTENNQIPLVLTFHPFNFKVRDLIRKNFHILKNDPETSSTFSNNPLVSFRHSKNIQETLVHSNLHQESSPLSGTFPCGVAQCKTCKFKFTYNIKHKFTCTSTHLTYCIFCSRCGMLYIGETGRQLRFREHRRAVSANDANQPVARHFNSGSHCISDMKIRALCPISGSNDSRKRQEMRLIFKLGTIHPLGINERFSFI